MSDENVHIKFHNVIEPSEAGRIVTIRFGVRVRFRVRVIEHSEAGRIVTIRSGDRADGDSV